MKKKALLSSSGDLRTVNQTLNDQLRRRRYTVFCLSVVVVVLCVRFFFSLSVPASPMFSDDYGYLKKSIYYLHGNFAMGGIDVDRQNQWGGLLYPFVIAPWQLFEGIDARHRVVFFLNSCLAALAFLAGCSIIHRMSGASSYLAPLCLAALPPLFLFTFYALTENLLFLIAVSCGWLLVRIQQQGAERKDLLLLVLLMTAGPLTRTPGFAIAAASTLTLLFYKGPRRATAFTTAFAGLLLAVATYAIVSSHISAELGLSREARYLQRVTSAAGGSREFTQAAGTAVRLLANQCWYVLLACGVWPAAFLIIGAFTPGGKGGADAARRTFLLYTVAASALFLFFSVLHLSFKFGFDPAQAGFIYGRYSDPAVLLLTIAGLGVLVSKERPKMLLLILGTALTVLLLHLSLKRLAVWTVSHTINQAGWYAFSPPDPFLQQEMLLLLVLAVGLLLHPGIQRPLVYMSLLAFYLLTLRVGMSDAMIRGTRAAHSLAGARWIQMHIPETGCVGVDTRVQHSKAPNAVKRMSDVYRALEFSTFPRAIIRTKTPEQFTACQFLYSRADAQMPDRWTRGWSNGDYAVYYRDF